ncbi:MAG TPA: hypothetical protein VN688_04505, partial [Gemmataceae bacterium]|nr:hypothetical protein [Gemmataceae bacterium]
RPVPQAKPTYYLHHLQRFELDTPYTDLITRVVTLLNRPARAGSNVIPLRGCVLGLDATGVGRPVVDMFIAARPPCRLLPVTITGGQQASNDGTGWHVPKKDLVAAIKLVLQGKRILWDKRLPFAPHLQKELADFQSRITPAANEQFGVWREGQHDDLVLAIAIAIWLAERSQPSITSRPCAVNGMPDVRGTLHHGNGGHQL